MITFVHDLLFNSAQRRPNKNALLIKEEKVTYQTLASTVTTVSYNLNKLGLQSFDRLAVYLPKSIEHIASIFSTSAAGGVFVPINPVLKSKQVTHILNDCQVKILITHKARLNGLIAQLAAIKTLCTIILIDGDNTSFTVPEHIQVLSWSELMTPAPNEQPLKAPIFTSDDIAAILYTSGSTGKPKGVVLSHNNIVLGAKSVSQYLKNNEDDVILALLPLSFDYGLNQVMTSFLVAASCVLLDYLLPNDVMSAVEKYQVTGIAAVPPLWTTLTRLTWSKESAKSVRYFTNSGGVLSPNNLQTLRAIMPNAEPYLMYGLTEAFRSTYLAPDQIDNKIGSIGKAIPNAEIVIVNNEGIECQDNEPGELVHKGPLVSLGYWNAPEKTAQVFKPAPKQLSGIVVSKPAVWSGDTVYRDQDGYLFFVSRDDEMIKTSGYRISPLEVEEVINELPSVDSVVVIGANHTTLGQAIIAIISLSQATTVDSTALNKAIIKHCQQVLANYMVPKKIIVLDKLPCNANGKIDRNLLKQTYINDLIE